MSFRTHFCRDIILTFQYCVAHLPTIAINVKAYYAEDGDVGGVSQPRRRSADRISLSLKADNSDIIVSKLFLDGGDEYSTLAHPF